MPSVRLTIQMFGPLRVQVHGAPLPRLRARSVEGLLALLVLRSDRAVSRSWLAGTLWPDSSESQALDYLRHALVALRKALGAEGQRIHAPTRNALSLDLDGAAVDLLEFDRRICRGDEASLREAVALHTGPLLEGCMDEWVFPERTSREAACVGALEALADRAEQRGDHAAALGYLRRAETLDPLREPLQRGLMRVLAASRDAPAAIQVYREHRSRLLREMNAEPDEETTRLFQTIRQEARTPIPRRGVPPPIPPPPRSGDPLRWAAPPHPLTALIGREGDIREVGERLSSSRLVTLVGGGGVGKTRLALEVARAVAQANGVPAAFVALASLSDPSQLLPFAARSVGLREEATAEPDGLLRALLGRLAAEPVLLVLDDCEHLIEAVAGLAQSLLEGCPDLRILATSRQRLGLAGETAWRIPSLPAPDPDRLPPGGEDPVEFVRQFPAVQLFEERAGTVRPGFRLEGREAALGAARICHRLDGVPLAIELAAARMGSLTVGQLAAGLDDRFRLLIGGNRGALTRHQTLGALIDWSYDLLGEAERALLRRLSVFAGGWTLEAAEGVAGAGLAPIAPPDDLPIVDLLASLADKSLVLAEEGPDGLRYRMLETIREYGRVKLAEHGELRPLRRRHAHYCLDLAVAAQPELQQGSPSWLDRFESEHDNLRAALDWYFSREGEGATGLRLAAALRYFWELRGFVNERRVWLEDAANRTSDRTEARARVLNGAGNLAREEVDYPRARQRFEESLAIMQELGVQQGVAETLNNLGLIEEHTGDPEGARGFYEESLAIMRELGDRQGIAHSLYNLGSLARLRGDTGGARAFWTECRAQDEALGIRGGYVLHGLAELALEEGETDEARRHLAAFLAERREIGDRLAVARSLEGFAALAVLEQQTERAARLLGAATTLREGIQASLEPKETRHQEAILRSLRETLGEAGFPLAWGIGASLEYGQAIDLALGTEAIPPPVHPSSLKVSSPLLALPHPLTRLIGREGEVREVGERIASSRLVTLVGGGGVGKTRLALEVAARAADEFPGGAAWVELAPLADGGLIVPAIAAALGLREEGASDPQTLRDRLVIRLSEGPVLLALDNCEHVLDSAAELVRGLLSRCPELRVLATSRQRLGLAGETAWRVPSLPAPDPVELPGEARQAIEAALGYAAIRLFVERAASAREGFRLTSREEVDAVCQICRRLDGIPLAIELAAARVTVLPVGRIAARLDDRFRLLTGGSRGALSRHQTLRALIDWSYDLLSESERSWLRQLSVFAGGWTLEAAEALAGDPASLPSEGPAALDLLDSLVAKSLVLAEEGAGGLRYRLLETVREYALEKLRASGEEVAARDRHLAYHLHLADGVAPALRVPDPAALDLVEHEIGNIRAALAWAQAAAPPDASLRLAGALWPFWEMRGHVTEGREHLLAVLARADLPESAERAEVLLGAGTLAFVRIEYEPALALGRESLERFRALGDARGVAAASVLLGHASLEHEDLATATPRLEEALECCRRCGWTRGTALTLVYLSRVDMGQGDLTRARGHLEQALVMVEAARDLLAIGLTLSQMGWLAWGAGDEVQARSLFERSLEIRRRLGHRHETAMALRNLGRLARRQGDLERARSYLEESVAICREQGNRAHLAMALLEIGSVLYEQGAYDRACPAYEESHGLFRQTPIRWALGGSLNNLASTLFHLGEPARAQELHRQALEIYKSQNWHEGIVWSLERLAVVEALHGDPQKAARWLGTASVAREGLGSPRDRWDQADWDRAVAAARAAIGEMTVARLWAEGRVLALEEAIDEVLLCGTPAY